MESDPHELHNLYQDKAYEDIKSEMTLLLLKRVMSVKVRDIHKLDWDYRQYPHDVRFEPLESFGAVLEDIRASGEY